MKSELKGACKETVTIHFVIIAHNLPGGTEEGHMNPLTFGTKLELETSRIRSTCANYYREF
jgi:hypothetical protein